MANGNLLSDFRHNSKTTLYIFETVHTSKFMIEGLSTLEQ